jgi:hypothetical protein
VVLTGLAVLTAIPAQAQPAKSDRINATCC